MLDSLKGAVRSVAGTAQDALGDASGDASLQAEGKANQVIGQARQMYGNAVDSARGLTQENPFAAVGVVAILAFAVGAVFGGALTSRR